MDLVWPAGENFDDHAELLEDGIPSIEAELGIPVRLVRADPGHSARWICRVDPEHEGPAVLRRRGDLIEAIGRTHAELWETFSLRHTWLRTGTDTYATDAADLNEAVERIVKEIAFSYPAFALRGLHWERLCDKYIPRVLAAEDPFAVCQEWIAQLDDAHTAVHSTPRPATLPYTASVVDGTTTLLSVPEGSSAWEAGVRPGWQLHAPHAEDVARRTGASPHMRPYVIGRRVLSSTAGEAAEWRAGDVTWSEVPTGRPHGDLVTWKPGYLRIKQWVVNAGIPEAVDAALTELADCEELTLDLRGNIGGNLLLARATRNRFLRTETTLGTVRYCIHGELTEPVPMVGQPSDGVRWNGRLRVLTDPLTYSASEDFLLGLQGLEHVRVVGEPSGGGSGRPRTVRLLPGWTLNISTVLTYDRDGHCVENSGIPVDSAK